VVSRLVTIDFETFYDDDVGFKKQTTEEYIRDPRFEVIGVGIKVNDEEPFWVTENIKGVLDEILSTYQEDTLVLCHNTLFDGDLVMGLRHTSRWLA